MNLSDKDPTNDPVAAAFAELVRVLGAKALLDPMDAEGFERAVAFHSRVIALSARWRSGEEPSRAYTRRALHSDGEG